MESGIASRLAVIGAGPAGLMAAIHAARRGLRVIILERMSTPGLKLLASGSGMCNVSNSCDLAMYLKRYGQNGPFLKSAFKHYSPNDLAEFLTARGTPLIECDDGKLFPQTKSARDILNALLIECSALGIDIRMSSPVVAAEIAPEGGFTIRLRPGSPGDILRVEALCVATGGRSYPALGSDGSGFGIAAAFGHRIIEPHPALSPVIAKNWTFSNLSGLALEDRPIRVLRGGTLSAKGKGDVLFTHRGLSGPGILDLSRDIRPSDEIELRIVPEGIDTEATLLEALATAGAKSLGNALKALPLPERLVDALLDFLTIDRSMKAACFGKADRLRLRRTLEGLRIDVKALGGWDEAMATAGGVDLEQVDQRSMESKLVRHLYFAGEVLAIDGDTGGFNIQAAFSTGALAGASAARDLRPTSAAAIP